MDTPPKKVIMANARSVDLQVSNSTGSSWWWNTKMASVHSVVNKIIRYWLRLFEKDEKHYSSAMTFFSL